MIYNKPISDINWDDIVNFCNQRISENAYLDYKESFPSNLQKSICAFANTLGGIIIIGVEEDDDNKPVLPIKGIEPERGLSERIINIILSNITPPVFPEIQICKNQNGDRAIIIIRIPQSNQSPHAININTQAYIRTGNISNPEAIATLEKIFWLKDQRKKASDLKLNLIQEAKRRFDEIYERKHKLPPYEGHLIRKFDQGYFTLHLCPLYPEKPLINPPELNNHISEFFIPDYFNTNKYFPISENHRQGKIYKTGSMVTFFQHDFIYYVEFNIFGLYFYKQVLNKLIDTVQKDKTQQIRIMNLNEIIARIDQYIVTAKNFFDYIGYNGLLQFSMCLDSIKDYPLGIFPGPQLDYPTPQLYTTTENQIKHSENILTGLLIDEKKMLTLNKLEVISWTFGIDIKEDIIDKFYKRFKIT
ncbi:helix-turn-helix domain-containing protein [Bacteroidota bacterium]